MLLDDKDIDKRLTSPNNLMNRLASVTKTPARVVSIPPKAEEIIPELDEKLKSGNAKAKALSVMHSCLDQLRNKIEEVPVQRLATIAENMNRIITASEERSKDLNVQVVVYRPQVTDERDFDVIDITANA